MPTEGRRPPLTATGQPRKPRAQHKPKMSPLDKYQRGRHIAAMRARTPKPVAWPDIAKELGVSVRHAHEIYAQFCDWEVPLHDPLAVVDETIDTFTVAMREAWFTYEAAEPGSGVRVQALRAAMEAAVTRLQIMRAAGRAPRSLAAPSLAAEMQLVFRDFAELLRRHDVSDEALRDFLGLAESRMGRLTAVEGRALPSGA